MEKVSKNEHATTRNWKVIKASPEKLYRAFTDPDALALWMAPGEMTAKVHHFNLKVGGGYEMSLFYPPSEKEDRGKTSRKEDRYTARFLELTPFKRIVQAIAFDSENPAFWGEMIMETLFDITDKGTRVTILFRNIPLGISLEDNKKGTRLTLQKLARYVEIEDVQKVE
jgi:uncharacterized protein YndB with AHSA1/START domain